MLLWMSLVHANPPALPDLVAARADASGHIDQAETLSTQVASAQNAIAEGLIAGRVLCADAELTATARPLAAQVRAHRDEAQRARLAASEVKRLAAAPTVAPLVSPADRERDTALIEAAAHQARVQLELAAWNTRHLSALKRCPAD